MYENKTKKPLSAQLFRARLIKHFLFALGLLGTSLFIGTVGHVYFEGMDWQKAFLSASMLLSGLGLAVFPDTPSGQLFGSLYGLYSGFIFLVLSGIIIAPVLHRFLHRFHWIDKD